MYISEHKVKTAAKAAKLADEYVLTHRGVCEYHSRDDFGYRGGGKFRVASHVKGDEGISPHLGNSRPERVAYGQVQCDSTKICHYCKGRGLWKNDCPKRRNSGAQVKSAALAASDQHVSPVISSSQQVEAGCRCSLDEADFSALVSNGCVTG